MRVIAEETKARILKEQFIPDHVFLYVAKGEVRFFDADRSYTVKAEECCLIRKNHLIRFMLTEPANEFEPILFCFEQSFLHAFQQKYHKVVTGSDHAQGALISIPKPKLLGDFMQSIKPYYKGAMELDELFEDLKYEELLIILLQSQPSLGEVLFNFEAPQRIDLAEFMNRNFRFNVTIPRLAYLTGRSLSAFKRDFQTVFNDTPSRWLVKKRLEEAYFLIRTKRKKPSDFYLDLGFESLSHFSVAFKKQFGLSPSEAAAK